MFVVAIAQLSAPAEVEAQALGADLGTTVYEARLSLSGGFPAVVLTTPDKERALALLGALRARGHSAVACDASAVARSSQMTSLRRFALEDGAIVATDKNERLPFDDVLALLPAMHKAQVESEASTTVKKFSMGRAIATGGLVMSKSKTQTSHATVTERERVLYIFRRGGQAPWILRENGTHYTPLGASLAPSRLENFTKTVALLRGLAPTATYDDALMTHRRIPESALLEGTATAKTVTTSTESGTDLLAHLLALVIAKRTVAR